MVLYVKHENLRPLRQDENGGQADRENVSSPWKPSPKDFIEPLPKPVLFFTFSIHTTRSLLISFQGTHSISELPLSSLMLKNKKLTWHEHTSTHTAYISTNVSGMLCTHLHMFPLFVSVLTTKQVEAWVAVTKRLGKEKCLDVDVVRTYWSLRSEVTGTI